ncbi:Tryptophan synthase [Elsinoe australis]|uniref:Tryptophan synthase n=1 Tax=Elsinoe australis TaxID=40998 RepID=A0A2P8ADP2_9PEZI|nr:Tryptophan synthase [Elsinoe australis]
MAPAPLTSQLVHHLTTQSPSLLKRAANLLTSNVPTSSANEGPSLVARAAATSVTPWQKCRGCKSPDSINNKFYFALFAILGVGLVVGSIWFFFFAKNGGFQYEEGDFEDYKTVVLRRKGPDGKSMASSKSCRSMKTGMTKSEENWEQAKWAAMSVVARDEKGRKGIMAARGWGGTHSYTYRDDFTNYDGDRRYAMTEVGSLPDYDMPVIGGGKKDKKKSSSSKTKTKPVPGAWDIDLEANRHSGNGHHGKRYKDRDVRSYAKEKPAKVGGMNRAADGSHMDFSGSEISSSNSGVGGGRHRHDRAEKRVLTEAERMERQWRREARRAARDLAREGESAGSSRNGSPVKGAGLQRGGAGGAWRTPSPTKKRQGTEYRFSKPESEPRESYLNAYRPSR